MRVFKKSKWIWISNELNKDEYGEFFTSFYCEGSNAECRISCDGDYTMFVNGNMVESNQYGDFEHYKIFDEIDISKYIRRGKNTFAVLVWHFGEDFQRYKPARAGVIFEITSQDKLLLCSDEHILARRSRTYVSGRCFYMTRRKKTGGSITDSLTEVLLLRSTKIVLFICALIVSFNEMKRNCRE